MPDPLTARQIATRLDVTPRRVRQLRVEQGLPLTVDGGSDGMASPRYICDQSALDAWISEHWNGNTRRWRGRETPA